MLDEQRTTGRNYSNPQSYLVRNSVNRSGTLKYPTETEKEALKAGPDLLQAVQLALDKLANPFETICVPGIPIDPKLLLENGQSYPETEQLVISMANGEDEEDGGEGDFNSVASIDSIAHNTEFWDPISSQKDFVSFM
jgi:hypothetical protein